MFSIVYQTSTLPASILPDLYRRHHSQYFLLTSPGSGSFVWYHCVDTHLPSCMLEIDKDHAMILVPDTCSCQCDWHSVVCAVRILSHHECCYSGALRVRDNAREQYDAKYRGYRYSWSRARTVPRRSSTNEAHQRPFYINGPRCRRRNIASKLCQWLNVASKIWLTLLGRGNWRQEEWNSARYKWIRRNGSI